MHEKKFIFAFIDHGNGDGNGNINIVSICLHVTKCKTWEYDPTNPEKSMNEYQQWVQKHAVFKHKIKMWACEQAAIALGIQHQKNIFQFDDYKIKKMCCFKESEVINLNCDKEHENVAKFLQKKGCVVKFFKFSKGKKPTEWTDIFLKYKKTETHKNYNLNSTEHEATLDITPVDGCEGYIVQHQLPSESQQQQTQQHTQQRTQTKEFMGGDDDEYEKKYYMYKQKYLDLKNKKNKMYT